MNGFSGNKENYYYAYNYISYEYLQVCEKSMSGSGIGPGPFAASQFTRAKMLASGYLVRPYEGGGSTIHIVDHLDLEV